MGDQGLRIMGVAKFTSDCKLEVKFIKFKS
jgi:hypothetical protein